MRMCLLTLSLTLASALPGLAQDSPGQSDATRFLPQSTFGATPDPVAHVQDIGFDGFLAEQFGAPASGYPDLFSPTNQLLGSSLIAVPTDGLFFGVLSDAGTIGRINIAGQTPAPGEFVDDLAFGTPTAALVPESSTLLLLGIGLLAAAFSGRRYYRVRSKRSESR